MWWSSMSPSTSVLSCNEQVIVSHITCNSSLNERLSKKFQKIYIWHPGRKGFLSCAYIITLNLMLSSQFKFLYFWIQSVYFHTQGLWFNLICEFSHRMGAMFCIVTPTLRQAEAQGVFITYPEPLRADSKARVLCNPHSGYLGMQ